ncbi:MAG: PIN domain-containing protein [Actinomycetota bacterium]
MTALDSSVLIAAFGPWHESHERARRMLGPDNRLIAHVILETFSVLTRLPQPRRATPEIARGFLEGLPGEPALALSSAGYGPLLDRCSERRIVGGAVYDALVGATAAEASETLVTLDRRALPVYEAVGAEVELLD